MSIQLDGESLDVTKLVKIARNREAVSLSRDSVEKITRCRDFLNSKLDKGEKIYGTNTGVGEFCEVTLSKEELAAFQRKLIYSHSAGFGEAMREDWVRGAMAARANVHAKGHSACRLDVTDSLCHMLNQGVTPLVSSRGSVGACGDLVPMAEIALLLLGDGKACFEGELLEGAEAMRRAGLAVPGLEVRDGLALINGSTFIAAISALQLHDMSNLLMAAEIACAMAMEAVNANLICLDERLHQVRGFAGGAESARFISSCLDGGDLLLGALDTRVQDAYSLRSTPQIIGAARDALKYAETQVNTELNGVGDNPVFYVDDEAVLTGANFQGSPVSLPMEMVGMAVTSVCVLAERRMNRLLDRHLNNGLPMFLVPASGMNSGMMTSQYTADSLLTEQKILATPAYTGSVPGAGSQEDFVSMGMTTALKNQQILDNAYGIIGIELMAAAQALDLRGRQYGHGVEQARKTIRQSVPFLSEDRVLLHDHKKMADLVESGELVKSVKEAITAFTL